MLKNFGILGAAVTLAGCVAHDAGFSESHQDLVCWVEVDGMTFPVKANAAHPAIICKPISLAPAVVRDAFSDSRRARSQPERSSSRSDTRDRTSEVSPPRTSAPRPGARRGNNEANIGDNRVSARSGQGPTAEIDEEGNVSASGGTDNVVAGGGAAAISNDTTSIVAQGGRVGISSN